MSQTEQLSRWRLILGSGTQESFEGMGGIPLTKEELLMDNALAAIYGNPEESFGMGSSARGAGRAPPPRSSPSGWETCGPSLTRRRWRWCRTTPSSARG